MKFEQIKTFFPDLQGIIEDDAEIIRKSAIGVTGVDGDFTVGIACTPQTDRQGDIIWPMGVNADYYAGEMFFAHQYSNQISPSRALSWDIKPEGITLTKIQHYLDQALGRDIFNGVRSGAIKALSITVKPKEILQRGTRAFDAFVIANNLSQYVTPETKRIVSKSEWFETSWAPIPANPECVVLGVVSKNLSYESPEMQKFYGLDKPEMKMLIDLTAKYDTISKSVTTLQDALGAVQNQALQSSGVITPTPVISKAVAPVPNPAHLSISGLVDALTKESETLKTNLNEVWTEAGTQIQAIDIAKPIADVKTELTTVLDSAGSKADDLTRTQVNRIFDSVFSGHRTNRDGTEIRDIAVVDQMKADAVAKYLATIQPDPAKPLQAQSIEDYKASYITAVEAGADVPKLDMTASNEATASLGGFQSYNSLLANLMQESGSGDICQIQTSSEDERLCPSCSEWLDQFVSVSGQSDKFPSLESVKASGFGHINCRCCLVETTFPEKAEKSEKSVEKSITAVPVLEIEAPNKPEIIIKMYRKYEPVVMTPELLSKAVLMAQGKPVFI